MQATSTSLSLLQRIIEDYSDAFSFKESSIFSWSPQKKTIFYSTAKNASENAVWSLLHEIGHAKLGHKKYEDDFELLIMEVEAWRKAKQLAERYHLVIEEDHIEECLESYRNWLHQRSRCIECKFTSFQIDMNTYQCVNCDTKWTVPYSPHSAIQKKRVKGLE
jgi:hypothetical protein